MTLPPRPCLVHVRAGRPGGQERAVEMDRQHLLPVGEAELLDRMDDLDAGVADQDVDAAECRNGFRDAGVDRRLVRDVHCDADGASVAADLACRRVWRHRCRSAIDDRAPACAKRFAISLPMPLAAPVTMATLPSSSMRSPCRHGRRRCSADRAIIRPSPPFAGRAAPPLPSKATVAAPAQAQV